MEDLKNEIDLLLKDFESEILKMSTGRISAIQASKITKYGLDKLPKFTKDIKSLDEKYFPGNNVLSEGEKEILEDIYKTAYDRFKKICSIPIK